MNFSRDLRNYALVVAAVVLALTAVYWTSRPSGVHLTEAELSIEYTRGYARPPARVDPNALPGTKQSVHLPYAPRPKLLPATGDEATTPTQTSWYHFRLPEGAALPAEAYIYIPRWKTDGEIAIYVDGGLHYQSHANLQWNGSNQPLWIAFDDTADSVPPRDIVIRMRHVRGIGGALSSLWVGSYNEVGISYLVRYFFQAQLPFLTCFAFLATGIFGLMVWLRRRHETLYLYFFTMTVATFLRGMNNYMGLDRLPISDAWFGWITVNSVMWMLANLHVFVVKIHGHRQPLLTWAVLGTTLFFTILTLPLFAGTFDATIISPVMYPAMIVIANIACFTGAYWSWRERSVEGLGLAAWGLVTTWLGFYDWLLQNNVVDIEGLFLGVYAQIAMVVAFCHVALRRYTQAMSEVERANVVLAERLTAREAELTATHEKVREIERRELVLQERQRLMQDMHDGLGSSLVTALGAVEHGGISEGEMAQLLKSCIDDLKLTIDSMEPVETDLLLLLGTFRFRLQPRLESSGIKLRWDVGDVPPLAWLDQRHSLHILRILQESFTNIVKHAGASQVTVSTRVEGGEVSVMVRDNGRGFDPDRNAPGRGLANQARRAEAIGGRVGLESGPAGTVFTLTVPIEQAQSAPGEIAGA